MPAVRRAFLVALAAAAVVGGGIVVLRAPARPRCERCNVLLVTLDPADPAASLIARTLEAELCRPGARSDLRHIIEGAEQSGPRARWQARLASGRGEPVRPLGIAVHSRQIVS